MAYSLAEARARHVLESSAEGKYLHEPLLHCDLLGEESKPETTLIIVLTGLRLLTVDATTWRLQLNLPLRKVHSVHRAGQALVLQLFARRGGGGSSATKGGGTASAAPIGDSRRLVCFSDEATAIMFDRVQEALTLSRARRRIWHSPAAPARVDKATSRRGRSSTKT